MLVSSLPLCKAPDTSLVHLNPPLLELVSQAVKVEQHTTERVLQRFLGRPFAHDAPNSHPVAHTRFHERRIVKSELPVVRGPDGPVLEEATLVHIAAKQIQRERTEMTFVVNLVAIAVAVCSCREDRVEFRINTGRGD